MSVPSVCAAGAGNKSALAGVIFDDAFSASSVPALLLTHVPVVGTGYFHITGATPVWTIDPSGSAYCSSVDNTHGCDIYALPAPGIANYTVEGQVNVVSSSYGDVILYARCTAVTSGAGYAALFNVGAGICELLAGGSYLNSASISWSVGTSHSIKLVVSGSNITVYADGVLLISATNSTYTAHGYAGMGWGTSSAGPSTGVHYTAFEVRP